MHFKNSIERAEAAKRIIDSKGHVVYREAIVGDGENIVREHKVASWTVPDLGAMCLMQYYSHQNIMVDEARVALGHPLYLLMITYVRHGTIKAGIDSDFSTHFANIRRAAYVDGVIYEGDRQKPNIVGIPWDEAMAINDTCLRAQAGNAPMLLNDSGLSTMHRSTNAISH